MFCYTCFRHSIFHNRKSHNSVSKLMLRVLFYIFIILYVIIVLLFIFIIYCLTGVLKSISRRSLEQGTSKPNNSHINWEVVTTQSIFSGTFNLQGECSNLFIRCNLAIWITIQELKSVKHIYLADR